MGWRRFLIPNRNRADQTQPRTDRGCQREARFISNPVYSGAFPRIHVPLAGHCHFECLFGWLVFLCTVPGSVPLPLCPVPQTVRLEITSSPLRPCQRLRSIRQTVEHPQAKNNRICSSAVFRLKNLRTIPPCPSSSKTPPSLSSSAQR